MNPASRQAFQSTKTPSCSNCGVFGHSFRQCLSPVTSYGTLLFRVPDSSWNQAKILTSSSTTLTGFESVFSKIEVLLIQRRDSLGYVEMMRGKYNLSDLDYIQKQLSGMTIEEKRKLCDLPFEELWNEMWGADCKAPQFRNDKENSKMKLTSLRTASPSLHDLVEQTHTSWKTPEWGFPKGRRDPYESDLDCALREMSEETGLRREEVVVVSNMEPLSETFFGSNHIHYCHKYYIVFVPDGSQVRFNENNAHMKREIGNIGWFSLNDALEKIRPENTEKREILLRLGTLLRNFCPLLHAPK
jgi:8-oxo-dGTP pyrophosphatase MutT (NUDIX family)